MSKLVELLEYLKTENYSLAKQASIAVSRYSSDKEALEIASTMLQEKVNIDLFEMESLVRPDKFEFPKPDIGLIGVKDEENIEEPI